MIGCLRVYRKGIEGGLVLLWNERVTVTFLSLSVGHINAMIQFSNEKNFYFTGFYGNPNVAKRMHFWEILKRLASPISVPWLICGNFNEIVCANEKLGGNQRSQLYAFKEVLNFCSL